MNALRNQSQMADYLEHPSNRIAFHSLRVRRLLDTVRGTKDPIAAIICRANALVGESDLSGPPFNPSSYAGLRNVRQIIQREMKIDGRLVPSPEGFIVELRKDRPATRKNFTCAHEIAHTFFCERKPSVRHRRPQSVDAVPDAEEEMLCNVAAAELLMPSIAIRKIARDYAPSPESLRTIATAFETSLSATVIRLLRLGVWKAGFILWQNTNDKLEARWIAAQNGRLNYFPALKILNQESSGIFHTLVTGEQTTSWEYLFSDTGVRPCRVQSMRLSSRQVITSLGGASKPPPAKRRLAISNVQTLPVAYKCDCDGSGWRLIKNEGRTCASRCLATQHELSSAKNELPDLRAPRSAQMLILN